MTYIENSRFFKFLFFFFWGGGIFNWDDEDSPCNNTTEYSIQNRTFLLDFEAIGECPFIFRGTRQMLCVSWCRHNIGKLCCLEEKHTRFPVKCNNSQQLNNYIKIRMLLHANIQNVLTSELNSVARWHRLCVATGRAHCLYILSFVWCQIAMVYYQLYLPNAKYTAGAVSDGKSIFNY